MTKSVSANEARAAMIRDMDGATPSKGARGAKTFRTDVVAPSSARDMRAAMVRGMGASGSPGGFTATGSGVFDPHPYGWERRGNLVLFKSPDAVMDFWRSRPPAEKAKEEERTASAMRKLLVRPSRREFPNVPVLLDGQRMKGGMLDDAFAYLRMERLNRARAGAECEFDAAEFLAHALTNVVVQIWKKDPMRASMWPVSERRWQENLEADVDVDIRLLGIDFRTLAAPLLLTSGMA